MKVFKTNSMFWLLEILLWTRQDEILNLIKFRPNRKIKYSGKEIFLTPNTWIYYKVEQYISLSQISNCWTNIFGGKIMFDNHLYLKWTRNEAFNS